MDEANSQAQTPFSCTERVNKSFKDKDAHPKDDNKESKNKTILHSYDRFKNYQFPENNYYEPEHAKEILSISCVIL